MNRKALRTAVFQSHRYIGLLIGLIWLVAGLTGSLLVFHHEIDHAQVQIEQIGDSASPMKTSQERLSYDVMLNSVKTAYPKATPSWLNLPTEANELIPIWITEKQGDREISTNVYVNPYTGAIAKAQVWENSFWDIVYRLHYELLAGEVGQAIVGIAAALMLILSGTGIVLWPGWRKLKSGFSLKLRAHPKRANFDIHKVSGIITAVFLTLIAFTGFCWNFYEQAKPAVYAATFSSVPVDPVSQAVANQKAIGVTAALQTANVALPDATSTFVSLPTQPDAPFHVGMKLPAEINRWGDSGVYLDQYTGKVLRVDDSRAASLGDRVFHSFSPLHYGTFGGLPTRIFYVFVGLTPAILMVTGVVMWWYRKKPVAQREKRLKRETV